jgi:hypothetical protein
MADISSGVFTLLGFAVKWASDWLQNKRQVEREREARNTSRSQLLTDRRRDFQRQTLLDLQEALNDLARATGEMHHKDVMAAKQSGQWQKQLFGEEVNNRAMLAMRRTSTLGVRVHNDAVRNMVFVIRDAAAKVTASRTEEDSEMAFVLMVANLDQLQHRIGELLRKMDDEETETPTSIQK